MIQEHIRVRFSACGLTLLLQQRYYSADRGEEHPYVVAIGRSSVACCRRDGVSGDHMESSHSAFICDEQRAWF